jgi:hypothetical protein
MTNCSLCQNVFEPILKPSGLSYKTCERCRDNAKTKLPCECGIMIRKDHFNRHKLSKQHQYILDENERIQKTMNEEEIKKFLYKVHYEDTKSDENIELNIKLGYHKQDCYQWNHYQYV